MPAILFIANMFGISVFRLIMYAAIFTAVVAGALTIRQHYINIGWHKHAVAVEKQNDTAKAASKEIQRRTDECESQSYWDVISKSCKTEEAVK